jgi:signal transduction histidine kinase
MRRVVRWDWIGLVAGGALGLLDALALPALGGEFVIAGRNATLPIVLLFSGSFAALGFATGRLALARSRAREAEATIRAQLEALEKAQSRVIQQEKLAALGRVAAGIAHEVRNPLGVIRASASMLEERFEPAEDAGRACRFIVEEIDRLNGLITALLTFARPAQPRLGSVALEKVVDRALQLASDEVRARHLDLVCEVRGVLPEVRADADLLAQVVYGLVVNAAERLPERGRIELRLTGDRDFASIEVADSGEGVDAALSDQIFEPFFTTKAGGTGLGLAMAERIVEAHAGRLELAPGAGAGDAGAGACFRVVLPTGGPAEGAGA